MDQTLPLISYGILSLPENGHEHESEHQNGTPHGVLTSRIEKYESRDWRQDLLRDNMKRLNTVNMFKLSTKLLCISTSKLRYVGFVGVLIRKIASIFVVCGCQASRPS